MKPAASRARPAKRSRFTQTQPASPPIFVIDSDSDSNLDIKPIIKREAAEDRLRPNPSKQTGPEKKRKSGGGAKGKGRVKSESDEDWVAITRQCRVEELVVLDDAPEVWMFRMMSLAHGHIFSTSGHARSS